MNQSLAEAIAQYAFPENDIAQRTCVTFLSSPRYLARVRNSIAPNDVHRGGSGFRDGIT